MKEDAKWRDSIQYNKFINQNESNLFLRTNNACEGYNNRLRSIIKYSRTPLGYVIKKLIEEEGKYRQETLNILTRKSKKNAGPIHLKDLVVNMPLDKFLKDLLNLFKNNKELTKLLNSEKTKVEDINDIIRLDQSTELMNLIMTNLLEEDLLEDPIEENESQKYKYKISFKIDIYKIYT